MASAVTGPGVTTCRLVRISPRSASTTKPVACAVAFHSVSKARAASRSIDTTLPAMRPSVTAQSGLASAAAGAAGSGWAGPDCGGTGATGAGATGAGCTVSPGCGGGSAGAALVAARGGSAACAVTHDRSRHSESTRGNRICGWSLTAEKHQQPHRDEQHEGHEHRGGADVLGEPGEGVPFEADAVHGRFDGAVEEFHDENEEHRADEQRALDAAVPKPQP